MSVDPAAAELIRDLAACRTFEELCGWKEGDEDPPVKPTALDELIERARELVDTLGLHEKEEQRRWWEEGADSNALHEEAEQRKGPIGWMGLLPHEEP